MALKEKTAFVIMPYGGNDEALKKEYNRIYTFLIRTAVEKCGLRCVREDRANQGGHIMSNVVRHIVESEIVIADLSALNWNVAYELGIRHFANKGGTILMCNDQTEIPFDIQSLNIFIYKSNWMDDMETIAEELAKIITSRLDTLHRSDSPVHDAFPILPESVVRFIVENNDEDKQRKIAELDEKLKAITEERDALKERIESVDLDMEGTAQDKVSDIEQFFLSAVENSKYNSDAAVDHLRELLNAGEKKEYAAFLAKVLQYGYLDEIDCQNIYVQCRKLGIPAITKRYLETVITFYPDNDELGGYLARQYTEDYHNRDRAIAVANEIAGVRKRDNEYELLPKTRSRSMLATFCDVYLNMHKYNELLKILDLLLECTPAHTAFLYKNKSYCYNRLDRFEEGLVWAQKAVESDPKDDANQMALYRAYVNLHRPVQAYLALEKAIDCDRKDTDYYFRMADFICDEKIARVSLDSDPVAITGEETEKYAVPYLLKAYIVKQNKEILQRIVREMDNRKFKRSKEWLVAWLNNGDPLSLYDEYDFTFVNYTPEY